MTLTQNWGHQFESQHHKLAIKVIPYLCMVQTDQQFDTCNLIHHIFLFLGLLQFIETTICNILGKTTFAELSPCTVPSIGGLDQQFWSHNCMHTVWKNYPNACKGFYRGKQGCPSIIFLEDLCNYYLWFWHVVYCFPGALNIINILNMPPLMAIFSNGNMSTLERE